MGAQIYFKSQLNVHPKLVVIKDNYCFSFISATFKLGGSQFKKEIHTYSRDHTHNTLQKMNICIAKRKRRKERKKMKKDTTTKLKHQ